MKHTHLYLLLATAAALSLAGCGDGPMEASETRVVMPAGSGAPASSATSEERFGMVAPKEQAMTGASAGQAAPLFAWEAPEGWRDAGSEGLRLANFVAGPNGEAECYLTVLGGTGGGVEMNVNRWRAQMGLAEAGAEELAALAKVPMLGGEAVLVDVAGSYGGMQDDVHTTADAVQSDYALLGAILMRDADAVFLKMTGPADVIRGERGNFIKFAGSLRDSAASCPTHGAAAGPTCPSEAHACPSTPSPSE